MGEVLFINACLRPNSRTLELARYLLGKMDGQIDEVNLSQQVPEPLDLNSMNKRDKAAQMQDYSDEMFDLAKQFAKADSIVVAAPYWDLMFPAVLRSYFEAISVSGLTFRYTDEGMPIGLCKAKKIYYITTAGGYIGENNFGFLYLKALARSLYGIKDVICFCAEGLDIDPDKVNGILEKAKERIDESYEI